jgi:membrane associated rhomboid family serine protease
MTEPRGGRPDRVNLCLAGFIGLLLAIELVLLGADWGLWGHPRLRSTIYDYTGFWPGLLYGWQSNYPGQGVVMFVSYSVVHGGPGHALVNMVTLWSLGRAVADWVGGRRLILVYGAALLGGAVAYGLLTRSPQPMVGASGALFGLAGALMVWASRAEGGGGLKTWRIVLQVVGFLVAMNVAMWWALDGQLAWQTHLGGFLAGAAVALLLRPVQTSGHNTP